MQDDDLAHALRELVGGSPHRSHAPSRCSWLFSERQCEAYLRDIDVCDGLNDQIRAEQKAMAARLLMKVRAAAVETRP